MAQRSWRRAGAVLAGALIGLGLVAAGVWMWLQSGQVELSLQGRDRLDLPPKVLEDAEVTPEGRLRLVLRDVALVAPGGDTVVFVPQLRLAMSPDALAGPGPVSLAGVVLRDPTITLERLPGGEWNIARALRLDVDGEPMEMPPGILLRDIRVINAAVVVRTAARAEPLVLRDLDATIPLLRVGTDRPWRVEIAELDARLRNPDLRLLALQGSVEDAPGSAMRVDLSARVAPGARDVPPSRVALAGLLELDTQEAAIRFAGTRLELEPLQLAVLAPVLPGTDERLRGVVRGEATLTGPLTAPTIERGQLAYQVGDAPPTRLADLALDLRLDPFRAELRAVARPLALETLRELFPALPVEPARLVGPIHLTATEEEFRFDVELRGPRAGLVALQGRIEGGDPTRFDLTGRLREVALDELLSADLPFPEPVTGTLAVRGTPERLALEATLLQPGGALSLQGLVRPGDATPFLDLEGKLDRFRVGRLVGRPGLFTSPLTGTFEVVGGDEQPYRFAVDLTGRAGRVDLEGRYDPGDIPEYAVAGRVAGLDLAQLPALGALPRTELTARVAIEGRGLTLETLAGELTIRAGPSTISGVPLDALRVEAAVRDGVLRLDTLVASVERSRLVAEGVLGLTRPVPGELEFALVVSNLATVARLLPGPPHPRSVGGSARARGRISGALRSPSMAVALEAEDVRYRQWWVDALAAEAELTRQHRGWSGTAALVGDDVATPGTLTLDEIRMEADLRPDGAAVVLAADAGEAGALALAARVPLDGLPPERALLTSLALRLREQRWVLARTAPLRWGAPGGLRVEELRLRRAGPAPGRILLDGQLPLGGPADFFLEAEGIRLSSLRPLLPRPIPIDGALAMALSVEGPVASPVLELEARLAEISGTRVPLDRASVDVTYSDRRLAGEAALWNGGERLLTADGLVPVDISVEGLSPRVDLLEHEPLRAELTADSLPLAMLTLLAPGLENAEGLLEARVTVRGTPADPYLSGRALLQRGAVTIEPLGVRYEGIRGRFLLEDDRVLIAPLVLHNDGVARVTGAVLLAPRRPVLDLEAVLEDFRAVDQPRGTRFTASGRLALAGPLSSPSLSGRAVLSDGVVQIGGLGGDSDIAYPEVGALEPDSIPPGLFGPFRLPLELDSLELIAGEEMWLSTDRGRGEVTGALVVATEDRVPRIEGALKVLRGLYVVEIGPLVREFDIRHGRLQFFGLPGMNPTVLLAGEPVRRILQGDEVSSELVIHPRLTGTLEDPQVELDSDRWPPIPHERLLSLLLFGRSALEMDDVPGTVAGLALLQEAGERFGGDFPSWLSREPLRAIACDSYRLRSRPVLEDPFGSPTLECVWRLEDAYLALEAGPADLGAWAGAAVRHRWRAAAGWQLGDWSLQFRSEPAYRDPLLEAFEPVERRWSLQLLRWWESGEDDGSPGPPLR